MITDWDAAYANSAIEPDAPAIFARWAEQAAAFRAQADMRRDVPYGRHPRERLDLFAPQGAPKGLMVYIHGGYWRAFDKDASSHLAQGMLAQGWAVAIPSYPLCPEFRIAEIGHAVAQAITHAAGAVGGPIVLCGHSAGGHLAARMMCDAGPLPHEIAARVALTMGISGVYDLRPLTRTAMNDDLRLDSGEAASESPALLTPHSDARLVAWAGGAELPEFRRQSALIANIWSGLGAETDLVEAPGARHFDVIDPLTDPGGAMVARLAGIEAPA